MRLVYMGTPQFAVEPLRALAAAGHDFAGVVTRTGSSFDTIGIAWQYRWGEGL